MVNDGIVLRAEGAEGTSPGQRPGESEHYDTQALKVRNNRLPS